MAAPLRLNWEEHQAGSMWMAFDPGRFLIGQVAEMVDGYHAYLWSEPVGVGDTLDRAQRLVEQALDARPR